ncbi:hypothetical protein TrVE_jg9915 [Triparma verrucosa]|uniref:Uncharacterized protein n=1 Tax=Triparma verrucosa TaxID=1606542 RepID=A0A9W7CF32_9STRA|nr:hypothetical protein TrVE_jg9915 [Triparma verrucosa]
MSALSALSPRNSSKKTPPSNASDPAASPVGVGTKFLHKVPGYGDWEGVVTKVTVLDGVELYECKNKDVDGESLLLNAKQMGAAKTKYNNDKIGVGVGTKILHGSANDVVEGIVTRVEIIGGVERYYCSTTDSSGKSSGEILFTPTQIKTAKLRYDEKHALTDVDILDMFEEEELQPSVVAVSSPSSSHNTVKIIARALSVASNASDETEKYADLDKYASTSKITSKTPASSFDPDLIITDREKAYDFALSKCGKKRGEDHGRIYLKTQEFKEEKGWKVFATAKESRVLFCYLQINDTTVEQREKAGGAKGPIKGQTVTHNGIGIESALRLRSLLEPSSCLPPSEDDFIRLRQLHKSTQIPHKNTNPTTPTSAARKTNPPQKSEGSDSSPTHALITTPLDPSPPQSPALYLATLASEANTSIQSCIKKIVKKSKKMIAAEVKNTQKAIAQLEKVKAENEVLKRKLETQNQFIQDQFNNQYESREI